MWRAGRLSANEFWAHIAASEWRVRDHAEVLPCYGVVDWPGPLMLGDWEWENDHLVVAGLAHGHPQGSGPMAHVSITTKDPYAVAHSRRMRAAAPPRDKDEFLRRIATASPGDDVEVTAGAGAVTLTVWHDGDREWAAGHIGQHGVVIETRGVRVIDLALARVRDLEPYLAGRRAFLREIRGEN